MGTMSGRLSLEEAAIERRDSIDFKMVTFSLAGKDYGLDIMKVKEIAKDSEFTYVPNTAPYVRGVYNLRGDIISVIDLRLMFRLPVESKEEGTLENLIILNLKNHIIGIIVDSTNKVIGINSETIQPPHPLFGDINEQFISGVVEFDNNLYIILDAERIFGSETGPGREAERQKAEEAEAAAVETARAVPAEDYSFSAPDKVPVDLGFISETLNTFKKFHVSPLNERWVSARFEEWRELKRREGRELQLKSPEEADEFLLTFFSPFTSALFGDDYSEEIIKLFPEKEGGTVSLWNPGCGKGYETFSLACLLREAYPGLRIKIWANDNDLLGISNAPGLVFKMNEIPSRLERNALETKSGRQFNGEIRDSIYFEYHDILNGNPHPEVDIIFARDILSFQTPQSQEHLLEEFSVKLKPGGLLFLGENESAAAYGWIPVKQGAVIAYARNND